ncbi:MAG: 1-acyl-sn-glycerol-3-phosphate acyltransferase [Treponema sp.]|nr:1-acyl-sn-glycerol-3-phosphate acyltransferase [Treponema sp.]
MGFRRAAVSFFLKGILSTLCKVDCRQLRTVLSRNEPLLIIFNHINFLEVPIVVSFNYPVYVSGLVKSETWNNPLFAFLFNTYKAIPIDRTGAYSKAFKKMCNAVDNGYHMCVAPEGTRSKNGVLGKGKAGIIQLAMDANVPILPVAHHGGEKFWENLRRLKRTPFCFKAGNPFRIKFDGRPGKEERELIITEMMGQIASLLPEHLRGIYSDQANSECKYLDFI